MFPLLRELDIGASRQSQPDGGFNGDRWGLEFLHASSFTHLRQLRINRPFSPNMLPQIFFLPNLQTLQVSAFDASNLESWSLPQEFIPGRSTVSRFSFFGILTPSQLLQIVSWPSTLESFAYHHEGHQTNEAQLLIPKTFYVALQPFCHTLTNLSIQFTDLYFIKDGYKYDKLKFYFPLPSLKHFISLEELQVPSFFLFDFHSKEDDRSILPKLLPSSLSSLEITFGSQDVTVHVSNDWALPTYDNMGKYAWLAALGEQCTGWGQLPALKKVMIRQEGYPRALWLPPIVKQIFVSQNVQIELRGSTWYENNWSYQGSRPEEVRYWMDFDEYDIGPMFGKEDTEYSDSPRGSEEDEHAMEYEMLDDESWEHFDESRAEERAKIGERWIKGQWPHYEETREVRDEIFRYSERGLWFLC